jgi:hypothetical protein
MKSALKNAIDDLLDAVYGRRKDVSEDLRAFIGEWERSYHIALAPVLFNLARITFLLSGVSFYILAPDSVRAILTTTYALLTALTFPIKTMIARFGVRVPFAVVGHVALLGLFLAFFTLMRSDRNLDDDVMIAAVYSSIGFAVIVLTPFYNGLAFLYAALHVGLGVVAWGDGHELSRIVAWALILFHFDMFALACHVHFYRQLQIQAQVEHTARELLIANERLYVDAIQNDMLTARQIQDSLSPNVEILRSALATVRFFQRRYGILGGDWMGVRVQGDGSLVLGIADVTGKGLPAAMVAQSINTLWARALTKSEFDPLAWIEEVNETLLKLGSTEPHTASLGVTVVERGKLTYYSCGHVPLFLGRRAGDQLEFDSVLATGNIVGLQRDLQLSPKFVAFDAKRPIDSILMGTDGIFAKGARVKRRHLNALLAELDKEGADALGRLEAEDDKLLIWVQPAA